MRILVVGSGGREHALCWKLAQEAEVHAAPGNPGIEAVAEVHPVKATDLNGMLALAGRLKPDLVLVGPENPLFVGLGDRLRESGFAVFGPNADGARLEGSKAFAKSLMAEAGVPTAPAWTCRDPLEAVTRAEALLATGPAVVKADGLAVGKGVLICTSQAEVEAAVRRLMVEREFGDSGETVVVEAFLAGREFSLFSLCNGTEYVSLPIAQDYKRAFNDDEGPNTGGMGSYSPVDWVSSNQVVQTEQEVVAPMLAVLKSRGIDYRGVLFSGLMAEGPSVACLEYNVRFGDPETQSLMRRIGPGFAAVLLACAKGEPIPPVAVLNQAAVTVVVASEGYPGQIESGKPIEIDPSRLGDAVLFHAGTAHLGEDLVTAGGRVLGVSSVGNTIAEARSKAYAAVQGIRFEGMRYRSDIGAQPVRA